MDRRAERFWNTFLFTENGRPKSGFGVYTFSLSIVFAVVYALCYEGAIRLLTDVTASWPVWCGNLSIAFTASAVGAAVCCLPQRFLRDRRLVLGGHLWLVLYAAVVLVAMLVILRFGERTVAFLYAYGWFAAPPVAVGTIASFLLYRRGGKSSGPPQTEPEWKKYVYRR